MLSFPQWAALRSARHKLQDELMLYYLFIGSVTRGWRNQRLETLMFAGQVCSTWTAHWHRIGHRWCVNICIAFARSLFLSFWAVFSILAAPHVAHVWPAEMFLSFSSADENCPSLVCFNVPGLLLFPFTRHVFPADGCSQFVNQWKFSLPHRNDLKFTGLSEPLKVDLSARRLR